MQQIKVPFLKHSELDHAATELLRKYSDWRGSPARPPIDVDEIVEGYLKLDFEVVDLRTMLGVGDVLGATWLDDGRICVDQSLKGKRDTSHLRSHMKSGTGRSTGPSSR